MHGSLDLAAEKKFGKAWPLNMKAWLSGAGKVVLRIETSSAERLDGKARHVVE